MYCTALNRNILNLKLLSEIVVINAVITLDAVDAMVAVNLVRAEDTVGLVGAVGVWVRWLQMVQYFKLQNSTVCIVNTLWKVLPIVGQHYLLNCQHIEMYQI